VEILTSQQMRAIDRRAIGTFGLPEVVLMENAGLQLLTYLCGAYPDLAVRRLLLLCGRGNNGGDTFVLARHLRNRGHRFEVLLFGGRREVRGSAAVSLRALEKLGVSPREVRAPADWHRARAALAASDLVIDGILGTGLSRPVRGLLARVFDDVNQSEAEVVAVDVPSGVNASTGEVPGVAVRATATVTFGAAKVGLAIAPGRFHAGSVHVAPIGLRPREHEHALVPASALLEVPRKRLDSTKYTAGSVLVVGGSRGLTGAPMLAALAAFRADAGYVAVAAPESTLPVLETSLLEVVKRPLAEDTGGRLLPRSADAILEAADKADAVAIGPGLGRSDGTVELVRILLERLTLPVVLDADALWELEPFTRSAPTVLTPHAGELARLLGAESREIDAHRLASARRAASRFGAVVLLKGADTIVASSSFE